MYRILNELLEQHVTSSAQAPKVLVDNAEEEDYQLLEKFGLVHYFRNPDKTYRYIYITRKGIIFIKKIREIEKQLERRFFDPVKNIQIYNTSQTIIATKYALSLLFDLLEIDINIEKGVLIMKDMAYKGTKNEREIHVDFINKDKIYCYTCESYSCEHVLFTKMLITCLNTLFAFIDLYPAEEKKIE
ncbi:MAG: hypothetical protein ACP5T9_05345 [Thermoplasmata archaeon]